MFDFRALFARSGDDDSVGESECVTLDTTKRVHIKFRIVDVYRKLPS
jgi:hypothetical protein